MAEINGLFVPMADIQEVVASWQYYLNGVDDWNTLVEGVEPKSGGCGLVYELGKPLNRPNEDFAIADMRNLDMAEPHYHPAPDIEIYFVLQGFGRIAVGSDLHDLVPNSHIVISPDVVHITRPSKGLVLAVVNTPPFKPDRYITVDENDPKVAEMILKLNS